MKHDFRYFFREGIRNMFSHGFMSFAAIGVTVACLVIMGTFSLVAYNANENLKDLQKENAVLAFVDENLSDNEAKALQSTLEKIPGAADCTFVSRQEARDEYVDMLCAALPRIPSTVVMQRIQADPAPGELLAPAWALEKRGIITDLRRALAARGLWQGCRADAAEARPEWFGG